MITQAQKDQLRKLRTHMAERTECYEIAATELVPVTAKPYGLLRVFFDHARFTIFHDGTYGSEPYGPIKLYGLKVGMVERPADHLAA